MSELRTASNNIGGPAFGNGIAYFLIWYLGREYGYNFDDPELAIAMGGAVIATVVMYVTRFFSNIGRAIAYMFNRMFPEVK